MHDNDGQNSLPYIKSMPSRNFHQFSRYLQFFQTQEDPPGIPRVQQVVFCTLCLLFQPSEPYTMHFENSYCTSNCCKHTLTEKLTPHSGDNFGAFPCIHQHHSQGYIFQLNNNITTEPKHRRRAFGHKMWHCTTVASFPGSSPPRK